MKSIALIGCFTLVLAEGCASHAKSGSSATAVPNDGPVIVQLEGRDQTLIIKAACEQLLYSFRGHDGQLLASDLSADQLRAEYPETFAKFKGALASGSFLHASAQHFGESRIIGNDAAVALHTTEIPSTLTADSE